MWMEREQEEERGGNVSKIMTRIILRTHWIICSHWKTVRTSQLAAVGFTPHGNTAIFQDNICLIFLFHYSVWTVFLSCLLIRRPRPEGKC